MDSKVELVVILSHELNEKIFRIAYGKLKKTKVFVSADFNTNRIYMNLQGKGNISKIIPEIIENLKVYFKDYKIGVRDYYVLNYEFEIPCNFVGTLKLPIVKTIVENGKTARVIFKDLEKDFLNRGIIEKTIRLIDEKTRDKKEKIIFDNKLSIHKKDKKLNGKIKKGIIKNVNFYLPETADEIVDLKDKLISKLKSNFNCKEIIIPNQLPMNLLEEYNISDLIPKDTFSSFLSSPEKKELIYEIFYLTGKLPRFQTRNKAILFNDIPITLYKALENTKQKGFFYYINSLKINLTFFEDKKYENLKEKIIDFFKEFLDEFEIRYRILQNKLKLREKEIDYVKFEVKSDKWVKVIDILFAEDVYTKVFKIKGKSSHLTVDLDKLFLVI
jgi:hypothetical protein